MKKQTLSLVAFGALCTLIYLGCAHRGTVSRSVASAPYVDPASVYGTKEFERTFQPNSSQESKYKEFIEEQIHDKNSNKRVEFPPGLNAAETADLWHLSEGSDVFPVRWFVNILSQGSNLPNTPLAQDLYRKFGVNDEPATYAGKSYSHKYPFRYVGMTASWTDAPPLEADAVLNSENEPIKESAIYGVRKIGNNKSIAMVGTNCAFCHSGNVQIGDVNRLIDGAPNMMFIRGFFQDLAGSTVKTLLDEKLLAKLLTDTGTPMAQSQAIAGTMAKNFKTELVGNRIDKKVLGAVIGELSSSTWLSVTARWAKGSKEAAVKEALFKKQTVVQKYLERLLALTYQMKPEDLSHTMKLRMKWLSMLLGSNPKIKVTPEGYARTDAFGRISNWVARGKDPIDLIATVSVPPMWAIKYKAAFHYNSNTNSVIMRNVGQAFGLGAILTGQGECTENNLPGCTSTINLHNLNRLESLLYKLKVPNWQELFPEDQIPDAKVDVKMAVAGCEVFQKNCVGCHDSGPRVGPANKLVSAQLFTPAQIGTDAVYAWLQGTPVTTPSGPKAFREALFTFTKNVRDQYFKQHLTANKQEADYQISIWQREEFRGPEIFRDTFLGESSFGAKESDRAKVEYMNNSGQKDQAYSPRNLAGVWATAPYLHNGSVQNIMTLLQKERPRFFFLGPATYDVDALGFDSDPSANRKLTRAERWANANFGSRLFSNENSDNIARCRLLPAGCFDAEEVGNSNAGHEKGTHLTLDEKRSLIEFLKVLRPEPEYSWRTPPVYKVNHSNDGNPAHNTCSEVPPSDLH